MDPLSVTASVIAVLQLTNEVIRYLLDVKDAPKECQQCTIEASNLQNLLTNLHYRLRDATTNDPWYDALKALNDRDGPFDQYGQALEQLLSRVTIHDGLQKIGKQLLWKFKKVEVANILARMERLKSLVGTALEMDHFKLSQAIKSDVLVVQNILTSVKADVAVVQDVQQQQWDAQKLQQHQALMQWLSASDFAARHHDIISRKEEGTGQWFLDSAEFEAWQQGPKKILFCPGIPGAGKTMIAAIAINHLLKRAQVEDIGVAYLFCNYKEQLEQTSTALLAIVLKQLIQNRPDVAGPVTQMYQKQKSKPSRDEIFGILQSVCLAYPTVYLVIDALDECTTQDGSRTQLVKGLRQLEAKTGIRLMFTSRFIPEVTEEFQSALTLELRASDQDVRRYVASQLSHLPRCVQSEPQLAHDVQHHIAEAVDGMFLLARLHVDSLRDKRTTKMVRATLQKLKTGPAALDSAYEKAVDRIEGQLPEDVSLAKRALIWITSAQRSLTTQELCHALAIRTGDRAIDCEDIYDIEDILSVCAGLVTVDNESDIIRLVHYTTQKYVERVRLEWNPQAELDIASACITYLAMDAYIGGSCDNDQVFEARLRNNVFFDYSARYWGSHAKEVQQGISGLALQFLCHESLVSAATQAVLRSDYLHAGYSQHYPRQTNGLHLVAMYGLACLAEMLLKEPVYHSCVDTKDTYGRTPLSWAAASGHEAVVRLLVEQDDVEADSKDDYGETPLSRAAASGHEAVVRLLLERDDVEANSKSEYSRTPLSWAAINGNEAMVRLLVERDDVEADSKDGSGETPLLQAAAKGHETVVRLLLEQDDVEADSKSGYSRTPLSWAAANGHEAVVRLLVERDDVEADSKDIHGATPLSRAAMNGHEAVVRLLVERDDVEADSKSESGGTPLSWAAESGHEAVVQLLVERDDVKADSKNDNGETPLWQAAARGHEAVVRLLVERDDVEADSKDEDGWTPLFRAAARGHEAVVRLLVERDDVEADSKNDNGETPLWQAAARGQEAAVRLLKSFIATVPV